MILATIANDVHLKIFADAFAWWQRWPRNRSVGVDSG